MPVRVPVRVWLLSNIIIMLRLRLRSSLAKVSIAKKNWYCQCQGRERRRGKGRELELLLSLFSYFFHTRQVQQQQQPAAAASTAAATLAVLFQEVAPGVRARASQQLPQCAHSRDLRRLATCILSFMQIKSETEREWEGERQLHPSGF